MQPSTGTQRTPCLKNVFQRRQYLARLLIYGGTKLLREKFDSIYEPEYLALTLNDPAIKTKLRRGAADHEWHCLYPLDPAKHVSTADFDLELFFKLLRTICGLTPPVTGWYTLPRGESFEEDLARMEYYCISVYHEKMTDASFNYLWRAISEAFLRIASSISSEKRSEWEIFIDELLQDPVSVPEVDNYVHELRSWRDKRNYRLLREIGDSLSEKWGK